MTHTCPDCGQACTCDMEDIEQDAPDDCCHECEDDNEEYAFDEDGRPLWPLGDLVK